MKIGNKEKILIFVLALLVVVALVVLFLIMPAKTKNDEMQANIVKMEAEKEAIAGKIGPNGEKVRQLEQEYKRLEEQKCDLDGFFIKYDPTKHSGIAFKIFIYENILKSEEYGFNFAPAMKKEFPDPELIAVEGSSVIKKLIYTIKLDKNSNKTGLVTVGDFYNFKSNILKNKSTIIANESLAYETTSEINEECVIDSASVTFVMYFYDENASIVETEEKEA